MSYSKQTWYNYEAGSTSISADRLNHMEDGIYDSSEAVDNIQALIPSTASTSNKLVVESEIGSQDVFNEIVVGQNTIVASGADSFEIREGSNVTITADTSNKRITISATGGGSSSGDMLASDYDSDYDVKTAGGIKAYVQSHAPAVQPATTNTLGGIIVGQNLSVDATGLLDATDTTYSSEIATQGGTDVSLVTTGEKYDWNNKSTVTVDTVGTASSTVESHQRIGIDNGSGAVYTEITGTKYMETTISISAGSSGSVTFSPSTSGVITSSSAIDVYTSIWGFNPNNVTVGTNTCTVSFPTQSSAISNAKVRIYIR